MARAARAALVVSGLVGLVACGRERNAVQVSGPYAREVNEAIPRIEKAVGLRFKQPPTLEVRSRDEVRGFLERKFSEELPAREIAGAEATYKLLGLLPDTMRLRDFMLALLTEQVIGYYDPATKVLYVIDEARDELAGVTIAHELIHALQDQYLNLDSLQKLSGDNDRQVAIQALLEGQATYEQIQTMLGDDTNLATRLPGGWDRVREMIREQSSAMPIFATAPLIIRETLIFPYLNGAEFMRRFEAERPGKVPFDSLPESTEQIMHRDAYFPTRDRPARITLPAARGGTVVYENNLGEFEVRLFLFEHLQDQNAAVRGAAGWDGDRYQLIRTSRGDGIVWASVWDSAVDAAEFHDQMDRLITKRFRARTVGETGGTDRRYAGAGREISLVAADVGGRSVVLYVEQPAGAGIGVPAASALRVE